MRHLAVAAALALLAVSAAGCLFTDDFSVFTARADGGAVGDGGVVSFDGPVCSCKAGMVSTYDCDPCAHRECDGCHFGACVLNASAECEYRGGTNSSSCGGTTSCRRCVWPKATRRFCTAQCTWGACQCCGELYCDSCE